jgi:hypothetical protein
MTVSRRHTLSGPIFNDEKNVNDLGEDKNNAGEKEDEIDELVDVHASFAGVLRHPPKVRSPRIGPAGPQSGQKNGYDQTATGKKGSPITHRQTVRWLKHGTKFLIFVIISAVPPVKRWQQVMLPAPAYSLLAVLSRQP